MTFAFAAVIIIYHDFAAAGNCDQFVAGVGNITHRGRITHNTIRLALHLTCHCGSGSRAPNMERTHRKLRAGFAYRLRSDDAYSLAHVYRCAPSQVAPVAFRTQTIARFTGKRGTNFHFIYTQRFDDIDRDIRPAKLQPDKSPS